MSISNTSVPFENPAEEENSAVKNQTQALLQKPVSPNVAIEKPETEAQKILKQEKFVSAADILKQEKISTPKDVLKDVKFPTATTILEAEGLASAADILAIEKDIEEKEKEKFRKKQQKQLIAEQKEAELLRLQDQYIQNIDPNNFKFPNQNIYDTKFGSINFDKAVVSVNDYPGFAAAVNFNIPNTGFLGLGGQYTFIPADYITKGVREVAGMPKTTMFFSDAFLRQDHWEKFLDKTQMIDISDFSGEANKFLKYRYDTNSSSVGFLMKQSDMFELLPPNSFKQRSLNDEMHGGEIQGLSYHPELKKLVYVTQPKGRAQSSYIFYDDAQGNSVSRSDWVEKKNTLLGKILGNTITDFATDIAQTFASIPYGAEIALFFTKSPELYASLKALEVAGKGGDLEDVLKAGVTAYAVHSLPLDQVSSQVTDYLYQGGQGAITNELVAKTVGGALTYSTFNGMIAAATGGDVKDAMTTGAIMGGVSNSGTEITNKIFGAGDATKGAANIVKIADGLNMSSKQFTNIFVNSSVSASIAASRGGDFLNSLLTVLLLKV
jgi:hypothetical protein